MHDINRYPAIRLVIPFISGLLLASALPVSVRCLAYLLGASVVLLLILAVLVLVKSDTGSAFGVSACIALMLCGASSRVLRDCGVIAEWAGDARNYGAVVCDWPDEKDRSYLLKLKLSDPDHAISGRKVYLYVPKDSAAEALEPGDFIVFRGNVERPHGIIGDDAFDYGLYLHRRGVSGTARTDSRHWSRIGRSASAGIGLRAVRLRHTLAGLYDEWGLAGNAKAVVSAVTLADKSLIETELRDVFSVSGTSHLLAVSGLHVGIMYACLSFLIPALRIKAGRWFKESVILTLLWAYAILIGAPLSIVRSLVMFTILALCKCLRRESSSVNSLALAAVAILVVQPYGIYDVGFQLSFLAVLSILVLQPRLASLFPTGNAVAGYFRDIITVSLAAQIGTAPLIAYRFCSLPTYFLLTNLLAIPIMFVIVALSMALWFTAWIPAVRGLIVRLLTALVGLLDSAMAGIVSLPGSSIAVTVRESVDVWGVYALMLLLSAYFLRGRTGYMVLALALVAAWAVQACLPNWDLESVLKCCLVFLA